MQRAQSSVVGVGTLTEFRSLVSALKGISSHTDKTATIKAFLGTYHGSLYLLYKLLLTKEDKRVYNIRDKQLAKLLSGLLGFPLDVLKDHFSGSGSMAATAQEFFSRSTLCPPAPISSLTLTQVDAFLDEFTTATTEASQSAIFARLLPFCTPEDLHIFLLLLNHDLQARIGAAHALAALGPNVFAQYKATSNLKVIIDRVRGRAKMDDSGPGAGPSVSLFHPIKPMLARACKSVEEAMDRFPQGMFAEIKYDGERIQIHKSGSTFQYWSRNLKPVTKWKTAHVEEHVLRSVDANEVILDGEILLISTTSGEPLPFNMFSKHKNSNFQDAKVCIFMFDILYLDGESLLHKPIVERRDILRNTLKIIPHHVELSEMTEVHKTEDLSSVMNRVIRKGLEGLVLKALDSVYTPASRHWIKIKKDYLHGMADSADLVVLGAYYGKGSKGGLLTTFLMGSFDPLSGTWKTVCRVGSFTDDEVVQLQSRFIPLMTQIKCDISKVPRWLSVTSNYVPDWVVNDPNAMPVWEIEGAEFSISKAHTANGISIRFPRWVRERTDKSVASHTSLPELEALRDASVSGNVLSLRSHAGAGPPPSSSSSSTTAARGKRQAALTEWASGPAAKKARILTSVHSAPLPVVSSPPLSWSVPLASLALAERTRVNYTTASIDEVATSPDLAPSDVYVVSMAPEGTSDASLGDFTESVVVGPSAGAVTRHNVAAVCLTARLLPPSVAATVEPGTPGFVASVFAAVLAKVATAAAAKPKGVVVVADVAGGVHPFLDRAILFRTMQDAVAARSVIAIIAESAAGASVAGMDIVPSPVVATTTATTTTSSSAAARAPTTTTKTTTTATTTTKRSGGSKPLARRRLIVSSADPDSAARLTAQVKRLGGTVQDGWVGVGIDRTHMLVADSVTAPAVAHVRDLDGLVVGAQLLDYLEQTGAELPPRVTLLAQFPVKHSAASAPARAVAAATAQVQAAAPTPMAVVTAPAAPNAAPTPALAPVFQGHTVLLHGISPPLYGQLFRFLTAHDADVLNDDPKAPSPTHEDAKAAADPASGITTVVVGDMTKWDATLEALAKAHGSLRVLRQGWVWSSIDAGTALDLEQGAKFIVSSSSSSSSSSA